MDTNQFDELCESVKQAGAIRRGEAEPAREFAWSRCEVRPSEAKQPVTEEICEARVVDMPIIVEDSGA